MCDYNPPFIRHLPVSKWLWDTARKAFSVRDLVAEVSQGGHSVSHEIIITPVMIMSKSVSVCSVSIEGGERGL